MLAVLANIQVELCRNLRWQCLTLLISVPGFSVFGLSSKPNSIHTPTMSCNKFSSGSKRVQNVERMSHGFENTVPPFFHWLITIVYIYIYQNSLKNKLGISSKYTKHIINLGECHKIGILGIYHTHRLFSGPRCPITRVLGPKRASFPPGPRPDSA